MKTLSQERIKQQEIRARDPYRIVSNAIAGAVVLSSLVDVEWIATPPEWMLLAAGTWVFGKVVKDQLADFLRK